MGRPSGHAGDGEDGCEEVARDAQHAVNEARVEVDVGGDGLGDAADVAHELGPEALHALHELEFVEEALLLGQLAGIALDDLGTGVGHGVDGVAQAVNEAGAVEGLPLQNLGEVVGYLGVA